MKAHRADLIKASSMAIGLTVAIAMLGYYVIPPYVFVNPGYSVYVTGIVDHKKIGHGYGNGELQTWYTVSVRLLADDPVNGIQGGETVGYIVTKAEWEMVEWGDVVKIRLLPGVKAEIIRLFPSLKLPEWHGLAKSASPISVELTSNKRTYMTGDAACFIVKIKNAPEEKGWIGSSIPLKLTLFKTFPFWVFRDGENVFSSHGDSETQEIILQPGEELNFSFEWNFVGGDGKAVPEGVYYVRVYLGFFTEDEETSLTATTMIGIET